MVDGGVGARSSLVRVLLPYNCKVGPHQHSSCVALCTAQDGKTALDHAMRLLEKNPFDPSWQEDAHEEHGKKMEAIVALLRQYQKEEA